MTRILFNIFSVLASVLLSVLILSSCDHDSHDPDVVLSGNISNLIPSYSVHLMCSYSMGNKYINLEAEPYIYLNLDRWNLKIDKVDYYVDDMFCETKTVSPYTFAYESDEWYTGAHTLRADLTISGKNIESIVLPCVKVLNNSTSAPKAADIYFDINYVTTGDELCFSVGFNPERSQPGTKILSAKAYWDEASLGEKTSAPYKFTKRITEAPGTKHNLTATVTYEQGNVKIPYNFSYPSYEICGPTTSRQYYSICSKYRDFENGENLKGKAYCFKGSEVTANYGLELYLDDVLIAESKEFPYEHEYLLSGLSVGEHTLKEMWVRYDADWKKQGSISSDETITITK